MEGGVLIDNWLLQDIGECLAHGLIEDTSSEILVHREHDRHEIREVSSAGVRLQALLDLLVHIVFRDSLVLDSDFTDTWESYKGIFKPLVNTGLVRDFRFLEYEDRLRGVREFAVDRLCATSTLRDEQDRNEESWAEKGVADNPYMSQVIWGTAGMLSRSHVFEAVYSGHPLRQRLIAQSEIMRPKKDIVSDTLAWLDHERMRLYESRSS